MKTLIAAAALALALCGSAQAATYTYTSTASQEAIITDARARANVGVVTPVPDNTTFIANLLLNAIASWDQTRVAAPTTVAEKNLVLQLLNADIARADGNSAVAQVLKDRILANQ